MDFEKPSSRFAPKKVPMVIPPFTAHWLRHTYITMLYLAGVDVLTAKEQAGHAPTTPIVASIIGAVQAQEAVKVIAGMPTSERMLYYEGEHLTARTIDHRAWDDDCPLHETWEPVERRQGLSLETTVGELTQRGFTLLLNDPFVDHIVERETDRRTDVMCAAHSVEDFMESHPTLRYKLSGAFYQNEYTVIDSDFPHKHLTLRDLGIPPHDIIRIKEENNRIIYVEI